MDWETDDRVAFFFAGGVIACFITIVSIGYAVAIPALKEWQTLATGLLAAVAAIITVFFLAAQIRQGERFELERRKSKNLAARAAIHQPLSNIISDQGSTIEVIASALEQNTSHNMRIDRSKLPEANSDYVQTLVNCLEFSDNPVVGEDLSKLISLLQIQNARLRPIRDRSSRNRIQIEFRTNAEHYLIDALEIYARSERLLLYARHEDQEYKDRRLQDSMRSAAFLNSVDELNSSFEETFKRRLERLS